MNSRGVQILWSPNREPKFIKVTSKCIELLELKSVDSSSEGAVGIVKIATYVEVDIRTPIQSVSWHCCEDDNSFRSPSDLVAVGFAGGVIKLINLFNNNPGTDEYCLNNREIKPRNSKAPVSLLWNPFMKTMLAHNLDKTKGSWSNEASVLIWKFEKGGSDQQTPKVNDQPTIEYCKGEMVNSLTWIEGKKLICGVSNKYLKIFDTLSSNPQKIVSTDAVFGLCCEYCPNKKIASYVDDRLVLWSEEKMDKPVLTVVENYNIENIEWSPHEDGLLCVMYRDKHFVSIVNTNILLKNMNSIDSKLIDYTLSCSNSVILSATWCTTKSKLILLYTSNDNIELHFIRNRVVTSIAVDQSLTYVCNTGLKMYSQKLEINQSELSENCQDRDITNMTDEAPSYSEQQDDNDTQNNTSVLSSVSKDYTTESDVMSKLLQDDLPTTMKQRVLDGYGQKTFGRDSNYSIMFDDDSELKLFWKWIEDSSKFGSYIDMLSGKSKLASFTGVIQCLKDVFGIVRDPKTSHLIFQLKEPISRPEEVRWNGVYDELAFPKYCHPFRDKIFHVCGWPFNRPLEQWRYLLEGLDDKERAAAMALITLNFDVALSYLKILSNVDPIQNEILRLCLAGFNTQGGQQGNSNWSHICRNVLNQLGNSRPYLSLIFRFLITEKNHNLDFLKTLDILLVDKLAIAALYFDDNLLIKFCNYVSENFLAQGRLQAVIMTGLGSREFVYDLLQNYLNQTNDIQTAAIAVLQAGILTANRNTSITLHNPITIGWIEGYRNLLDVWKLWFYRADFDIANNYYHFITDNSRESTSSAGSISSGSRYRSSVNPSGSSFKHNNPVSKAGKCQVYVACNYCGWKISQPSKYTASIMSRRRGTGTGNTPGGSGSSTSIIMGTGGGVGSNLSGGTTTGSSTVVGGGSSSSNSSVSSGSGTVAMHAGGCKATICQNCRKPLPRCSVCLMNMDVSGEFVYMPNSASTGVGAAVAAALGGGAGGGGGGSSSTGTSSTALAGGAGAGSSNSMRRRFKTLAESSGGTPSTLLGSTGGPGASLMLNSSLVDDSSTLTGMHTNQQMRSPIGNWFTWCQYCKHGGHADHLRDWFTSWTECPVTDCRCQCCQLDSSYSVIPRVSTVAGVELTG